MNHIFFRRAFRTLVFVLATSLAGFASVIGTFDRSFQVIGPVDLEVLTRSGDITVRNGACGHGLDSCQDSFEQFLVWRRPQG